MYKVLNQYLVFSPPISFYTRLKTSEKLCFSNILRGYIKRSVAWKRLTSSRLPIKLAMCKRFNWKYFLNSNTCKTSTFCICDLLQEKGHPILRVQPRFHVFHLFKPRFRNLIQKYLTKTRLNVFWLFSFIHFG